MQTSVWCELYLLATLAVVLSNALSAEDEGVCSKTETYVASQSERVTTSFVQSYETCNLFVFCSTKYRTAYRSGTRTAYRLRSREYLVCCNGYVQVDLDCKLKVPPTTTTTTTSTMPTAPELTTAIPSTVPTHSVDETTPSPDMASALPGSLSLPMEMMVLGGAGILFIIVIVAVVLAVVVIRRKRKRRPRLSSSNTGDNGEYIQPHGAYYSIIRSTTPGNEGTDADSSSVQITPLPHGSAPGPPTPDRTKKNTFKNLSLFYAKIIKGKNKARDSDVQSYDSGSQAAGDDQEDTGIVHYYSDMDSVNSTPQKHKQSRGYIDMRSPTSTLAAGAPLTGAQEESNVYSEMDNPCGKDNDGQTERYNEFEPYDKLNRPSENSPEKKSPESNSYDHLARTVSSTPSAEAGANPYDKLDKGGAPEEGIASNGQVEDCAHPYDHLSGGIKTRNSNKDSEEGRVLRNENPDQPVESTYYNTPEENALKRRQSQQDAVYANVS